MVSEENNRKSSNVFTFAGEYVPGWILAFVYIGITTFVVFIVVIAFFVLFSISLAVLVYNSSEIPEITEQYGEKNGE